MGLLRTACAASCVVLLAPVLARAGGPPGVTLEVSTTCDFDVKEARLVLASDLGATLLMVPEAGTTRVDIACDGDKAAVTVRDPLSKKVSERSFDLARSDRRARARLVGLGASELVLATWAELESLPPPRAPAAGPDAPASDVAAARDVARSRIVPFLLRDRTQRSDERDVPPRRPAVRVLALGSRRSLFGKPGALWGGGGRVAQDRFTRIGWAADVLVEAGEIRDGDREYRITTGAVGGALFLHTTFSPVTFRGGAGIRSGVVRTQVRDGGGYSSLAPWGWPLLAASVTVVVASPLVLELAGETGYVNLPANAGSLATSDAHLSGAWLGVSLGLGLAL
jgi:hypothetical protein